MVLKLLRSGKGHAFGIEQSLYLEEVVRKRFILEIADDKILHLERVKALFVVYSKVAAFLQQSFCV